MFEHVPGARAGRQGAGAQGVPAVGRFADHRPHRGHDGHRRQHRQVHRHRRATSRRRSPRNNLEAAEEIVRQLRLRDIGGIIVIDFIDMVLPANRELLLRRLVECLGRDRTRHQVAEVTSLGLVQMTRKKIGTGLAEAFTVPCETCQGRGYHVHDAPVGYPGARRRRRPRRSAPRHPRRVDPAAGRRPGRSPRRRRAGPRRRRPSRCRTPRRPASEPCGRRADRRRWRPSSTVETVVESPVEPSWTHRSKPSSSRPRCRGRLSRPGRSRRPVEAGRRAAAEPVSRTRRVTESWSPRPSE